MQAVKDERASRESLPEHEPESWITLASAPALPIERGIAGPGLLANVLVRRFDDHLPYNRLENVYEREGVRLGRSTLYRWCDALRGVFASLVAAMLRDARAAPYLCVDATGVLVQAPEKCSRGHFWVLIAPARHVIFSSSETHDSAAVDTLLEGYRGVIVADAHAVYDHLYGEQGATEAGCWGHARAYVFKCLVTEPEIAREFLDNLRVMFLLERKFADKPRKQRESMRRNKVKVLVDRHFALCRKYEDHALEDTPRDNSSGHPLLAQPRERTATISVRRATARDEQHFRETSAQASGGQEGLALHRQRRWCSRQHHLSTLIASCHLENIEPESYLREVMCLLPDWSSSRILELAPCNWKQTREQPEAQQRLAANFWLTALRELDAFHARAT